MPHGRQSSKKAIFSPSENTAFTIEGKIGYLRAVS